MVGKRAMAGKRATVGKKAVEEAEDVVAILPSVQTRSDRKVAKTKAFEARTNRKT